MDKTTLVPVCIIAGVRAEQSATAGSSMQSYVNLELAATLALETESSIDMGQPSSGTGDLYGNIPADSLHANRQSSMAEQPMHKLMTTDRSDDLACGPNSSIKCTESLSCRGDTHSMK